MLFANLPHAIRSFLYEKSKNSILILPEGHDTRIIEASKILKNQLQIQCILGSKEESKIKKQKTLDVLQAVAQKKGKSLSDKIAIYCEDPTFCAGAQLYLGEVDAVVAGCHETTSHVIRAALSTVGLKPETKILSSAFLFALSKPTPGGESVVLYSDCAVIPKPTSQELCSIAQLSLSAFCAWTNEQPRLSFLSFSTAGSAQHAEIDHVKQAYENFIKLNPNILCDGEVQFDAACVPEVSMRKNSKSQINGRTNIFIFPDLNSGNIGYKMTQYIGGAMAWGPILLGTAKPFSDLSRGASALDIAHSAVLALALK